MRCRRPRIVARGGAGEEVPVVSSPFVHNEDVPMAAKKRPSGRSSGLLIDVANVVSVGRDRPTGGAVLRFRDEKGRMVAVRLRPRSAAR